MNIYTTFFVAPSSPTNFGTFTTNIIIKSPIEN
jgi:hypothetical protein